VARGWAAGPAIAVAVISIAVIVYGLGPWTPGRPRPSSAPSAPIGIVWADRVFISKAQLSAWLLSRGARYADWAKNHPVERARIEHRPLPNPASADAGQVVTTNTDRSRVSVFSGVWLLACLLMGAAVLLFERRDLEPPRPLPSRRRRDIDTWLGGVR
jgi:hypothetical protein